MVLTGKKALVTGGNSGLGLEVVKELIKTKCKVVILGKDTTKVEEAKLDLKSNLVSSVICDLRSQPQIEKTVQQVGDIDILINCAGIIAYQPLPAHDPKNIRDIVETNLLGTIYVTRSVLPSMLARNSGIIMNISSTSGLPTGGSPNESV